MKGCKEVADLACKLLDEVVRPFILPGCVQLDDVHVLKSHVDADLPLHLRPIQF